MAEVAASSQIWARKSDEESDTINNLSIDDPLALNNLSGKNHLSPAISSREISNISTAALTTFQRDLYPMSGAWFINPLLDVDRGIYLARTI